MRGGDARERGDTGDVGGPRRCAPIRGLGRIHSGVGGGVDDRVVVAPAACAIKVGGGEVEVGTLGELDVRSVGVHLAESPPQLSAGAENENFTRRNRFDVRQARVGAVLR